MVEIDLIAFAGVAFLFLHAFNSILPHRQPAEYASEEIGGRPISTV